MLFPMNLHTFKYLDVISNHALKFHESIGASFTNIVYFGLGLDKQLHPIVFCGIRLLIHTQTSTAGFRGWDTFKLCPNNVNYQN